MGETLELSKDVILQRQRQLIERELPACGWTDRQRLALTCRILSSHGHESGLAGQITSREQDGAFLTQALGCGMSEVRCSNLLRVDEDLNVLDGVGIPNPANRFHSWIYRARADVRCVVHTHPLHTAALSMIGVPLTIAQMDSCMLFDNVTFLEEWPGVPVGNEEGRLFTAALRDKSALLLANHGVVIVGKSIEEACVLALQFERAAQLFLLASAAGKVRPIDPALGHEARDWLFNPKRIAASFAYQARRELGKDASCFD